MSNIKLVAFDLDGTTVPMCGVEPTPRFCACVEKAAGQGVIFAPFTGRSMTTVPPRILTLPSVRYLSYSNGAGVYDLDAREYLYHSLMSAETCLDVLGLLGFFDGVVQIFSDGNIILERRVLEDELRYPLPPHHRLSLRDGTAIVVDNLADYVRDKRPHVDKINIVKVLGEPRERMVAELSGNPEICMVSSGGENLELNSIDTNKGNALRFLMKHLGLLPEQVMALGDNDNDIQMLEAAGLGVAMENATPGALAAATQTTLPQEQDGAAAAIERFVLTGEPVTL